jgi:hypothetical protein
LSDKNDQIERLKLTAISTIDESVKINSINTLEKYGEDGIDSIQTIISSTINTNVKNHGLQTITRIKSKDTKDDKKGKDWNFEGEIASDDD